MTDNTIIDKLRRSIEAVSVEPQSGRPLQFLYDDAGTLNIRYDMMTPPFAAAVLLGSGAVATQNGAYHDRITIAVWFADSMCQSLPDFDATENERIIDECKRRAFRWLASLTPVNELRLIAVNGAERIYLSSDAILTGYMVNVTLEELQGYGRCNA